MVKININFSLDIDVELDGKYIELDFESHDKINEKINNSLISELKNNGIINSDLNYKVIASKGVGVPTVIMYKGE